MTVSPGTRIWDQYKQKFHVDEAMWFAPGRKEYISFDSSHKFLKIPAGRRLMDFEKHLKTIREKGVLNPHTEAELRWAQERLADCFAPNYDLAMLLKREQRFEEASGFLAQALRIRPTFDKGWIDLGECYDRLGQLDQALVCWHQAAVTEGIIPQNLAISLFYLGLGLEVKGDLEGALGLWKRAAATFPSYGAPFQRLAERCVQLGRWTEAREAAETWARLDPESGRAWHHAALAALGQGAADTAQAHFEKAARTDAGKSRSLLRLCRAHGPGGPARRSAQDCANLPRYRAGTSPRARLRSETAQGSRKRFSIAPLSSRILSLVANG